MCIAFANEIMSVQVKVRKSKGEGEVRNDEATHKKNKIGEDSLHTSRTTYNFLFMTYRAAERRLANAPRTLGGSRPLQGCSAREMVGMKVSTFSFPFVSRPFVRIFLLA